MTKTNNSPRAMVSPSTNRERPTGSRDEQRYQALLRVASQIVCIASAEGELIDETGQWEQFTGQSQEEMADGGWAKALHPEDAEMILTHWKRNIFAYDPFRYECRLRRKDGAYCNYSVSATPIS